MSSQNYLTYQVLIPNDDLKVGQFPKTYLKDTPESYDYGAKTYEDFTKVTIYETTLPILIDLFTSWTLPGRTDLSSEGQEKLYNWYSQLYGMKDKHMSILRRLYGYFELIDSIHGYKNTKEYLTRALVYNETLWINFMDIMVRAARNLGKKTTDTKIIRAMKLKQPSDQEKRIIITYLISFKKLTYNEDWYFNMEAYGIVTLNLLDQIEKIFEGHVF